MAKIQPHEIVPTLGWRWPCDCETMLIEFVIGLVIKLSDSDIRKNPPHYQIFFDKINISDLVINLVIKLSDANIQKINFTIKSSSEDQVLR